MLKNSQFFIGLDVGTDSVGWATTDENYNLLRMKGKTAWGAHIFQEAQSAKSRRIFRCSGRRLERRKRRIELLNILMEPLINEKDSNFLLRLKESAYFKEDKTGDKSIHALFADKKLEREFHKKYPTIWHLRRDMCNNKKEAFEDIRCLYLALHHIVKYRGNFLIDGEIDPTKFDFSIFDDLNDYFKNLLSEISEETMEDTDFEFINKENQPKLLKLLEDRNKNKSDKKKEINQLVSSIDEVEPFIQLFAALIVGGEFSISKLGDEYEEFEKQKITLSNFDAKADEYAEMLGDRFAIVKYAKTIYDYVSLQDILSGNSRLSDAFASMYDSHHIQVKALKEIARFIDEKEGKTKTKESLFYTIFYNRNEKNNYAAFVGHNSDLKKETSIHDFNKFVLDSFCKHEGLLVNNKKWEQIKHLATNDMLCETISYKCTSAIPHQLHENELKRILDNAINYYPYIKEIKDKIISIFEFRVPYYCGPLNSRSQYSSVVKKEGKLNFSILPWNFDDIVDKEKTKENFIKKLTNQCTYLKGETVLPLQSIIYQDYVILNRLNSLVINGIPCEQKIKKDIFDNLVGKRAKTTANDIKKYLAQKYETYRKDGVTISGINNNDALVSSSRILFSKHFDLSNHLELKKAERIIYLLTIYSDNPKDAESIIYKEFKALNNEQKTIIRTFKSKGWGALSNKLLKELKWCDENGVCVSIYDILYNTKENFMQIINNPKYGFEKLIIEENQRHFEDYSPDDYIKEMIVNTPPKMRRSLISSMKIVDELVKVKKQNPDVISIEVTRSNDAKNKGKDGNEKARKKEIEKIISSLKDEGNDFVNCGNLENELAQLDEKLSLRGKHIYLYFKQLGIDVYTGKKIDINDVIDSKKYDVDHIIPQRLIKDDSLDNLVLVSRDQNQEIKGGLYPLPISIRNNPEVQKIWKFLHSKKIFSDKKYNNLIRATEITDDELKTFINAQLNVINHSNKVLRDILAIKYPSTQLIFSKAQYPSLIRQRLEIPKLRDLNDTHHAIDAYLNIITGTLLKNRFGDMALLKKRATMSEEEQRSTFNMDGYLTNCVLKGKSSQKTTLGEMIYSNAQRHDILLTYRKAYQDSEFYKMTILGAGISGTPIPIHTDNGNPLLNTVKYGSYEGMVPEYHLIATIETKRKNKTSISRIFVPVYHLTAALCKNDNDKIVEEIKKNTKLNVNSSIKKINTDVRVYPNQKVMISGANYLLCTFNEGQLNFRPIDPIFLDTSEQLYLSIALKKMDKDKNSIECLDEFYEFFTDKDNKNKFLISKAKNRRILDRLIDFASKKKYDFCPMINQLRELKGDEKAVAFSDKKVFEQVKFIKSCIALFGRKSDTIAAANSGELKTNCLKSKNSVLNDNKIYLVDDSITGLFSKYVEL